jgi:DNA-binding NtrC family response regulator
MKGTILVVDDDRQMVRTLRDVLERHDWKTAGAYSGEEAIAVAATTAFSAILMDVRMAGMTGVEALGAIRRSQSNVPVVLMTAYAAHELVAQAERDGLLALLPKPIHWPSLLELLEGAVHASGSILLVDDDPEFLRTLSGVLAESGHPSFQARTLQEALTAVEKRAPGVVILDLKLDHVKPGDVVLAINKLNPTTILILCSGYPEMIDQAITTLPSGRVYAALRKPFPPEQMVALLDGLRH